MPGILAPQSVSWRPLYALPGAATGLVGKLGQPTVFVLEGGYAVADIGVDAVNVLTGFEQAR